MASSNSSTALALVQGAGEGLATAGKAASAFGLVVAVVFGLIFIVIGVLFVVLGIKVNNTPPKLATLTPASRSHTSRNNFTPTSSSGGGGAAIIMGIIFIVVAVLIIGLAAGQYVLVRKSQWYAAATGVSSLVNVLG